MGRYWFVYLALSSLLAFGACHRDSTVRPPAGSQGPTVTTNTDRSQDYHFNNVACHKRADYSQSRNTKGAVSLKGIFEASGSVESKWEKAIQLTPKFEELEAVFFDICYGYGSGQLTKQRYDELREVYEGVRARLFKPSDSPTEGRQSPSINVASANVTREEPPSRKMKFSLVLQNFGESETTARIKPSLLLDSQPHKLDVRIPEEMSFAPHQLITINLPVVFAPEVDIPVLNGGVILEIQIEVEYSAKGANRVYTFKGRFNPDTHQIDTVRSEWRK